MSFLKYLNDVSKSLRPITDWISSGIILALGVAWFTGHIAVVSMEHRTISSPLSERVPISAECDQVSYRRYNERTLLITGRSENASGITEGGFLEETQETSPVPKNRDSMWGSYAAGFGQPVLERDLNWVSVRCYEGLNK
jgi:hypothetical protein